MQLRAMFLAAALWPLGAQETKDVRAPDWAAFTDEEMNVVAEINKIRMYPKEYARLLRSLADQYLSEDGAVWRFPGRVPLRTEEGRPAIEEAIQFLQTTEPCKSLIVSSSLAQAAQAHVRTQGPTGQTGHTGTDGSRPAERVERYGTFSGLTGEIISYGPEKPRYTVLMLVIDDGVPDRGHRKAIFNCAYRIAGPAIGAHKAYGSMTVVELADNFTPKGATQPVIPETDAGTAPDKSPTKPTRGTKPAPSRSKRAS